MRQITLLRGINVSGQKKIKMADLRAMCNDMGLQNVQTYIQSGNIIFDSDEAAEKLSKAIHEQIQTTFGFDVKIITRNHDYLKKVVENNPFFQKYPDVDNKHLYVTFLSAEPNPELVEKMAAIDYGADEYQIVGDKIYLCYPNGRGRSKLTNNTFEKKLKLDATSRNWRTTLKLLEMSGE